jgi:hypothetical protein
LDSGITHPLEIELAEHDATQRRRFDRHVVTRCEIQEPNHVARQRDAEHVPVLEHSLDHHTAAYHGVRHPVYRCRHPIRRVLSRLRAMPH